MTQTEDCPLCSGTGSNRSAPGPCPACLGTGKREIPQRPQARFGPAPLEGERDRN